MEPALTLAGVVLDAPDARALAGFYQRLLGWEIVEDAPEWVVLRPPRGGTGLSFKSEREYLPPIWPTVRGSQQMMLHLDIAVEDLQAAGEHAEREGAVLAAYQPQSHVRVYLDPAGHPFCLFLPDSRLAWHP